MIYANMYCSTLLLFRELSPSSQALEWVGQKLRTSKRRKILKTEILVKSRDKGKGLLGGWFISNDDENSE